MLKRFFDRSKDQIQVKGEFMDIQGDSHDLVIKVVYGDDAITLNNYLPEGWKIIQGGSGAFICKPIHKIISIDLDLIRVDNADESGFLVSSLHEIGHANDLQNNDKIMEVSKKMNSIPDESDKKHDALCTPKYLEG